MTYSLRVRRGFVALACVAIGSLAGGSAFAADQNWTIDGQSLKINSPCAAKVTIEPTDRLNNRVEVRAEAEHREEIDQLAVTGGRLAEIDRTKTTCWSSGFSLSQSRPTLSLTVRVPAGFALDIKEGNSGDYKIGPVGGPLDLTLSGSGNVTADSVKDVALLLSGSGKADITSMSGALGGVLSGSGDLTIRHGAISKADLKVSGSGDIKIEDAKIGDAALRLSGGGDVTLPAVAGLTLQSSGSGHVAVRAVDGVMAGRFNGSGSFAIDAITASSAQIDIAGSTDIKLGGGSIGSLRLVSHGSSDVAVKAKVGDADIELTGSGDVLLASVSGRMSQSSHGSGRIRVGGG